MDPGLRRGDKKRNAFHLPLGGGTVLACEQRELATLGWGVDVLGKGNCFLLLQSGNPTQDLVIRDAHN